MSDTQSFDWEDPGFDADEAGFMLDRPSNMPVCGSSRSDMRSKVSDRILKELTGVDSAPFRSLSYSQERDFWRDFFEAGKTLRQDEFTSNFMRERPLNTLDTPRPHLHREVDAA